MQFRDTWHVWERDEVHVGFLLTASEGKKPLGRSSRRREDNIKMDHRKNGMDLSGSE